MHSLFHNHLILPDKCSSYHSIVIACSRSLPAVGAFCYNRLMLKQDERQKLEGFVSRSVSGAPYRRRAQILLRADEGSSPEAIAIEMQLPVERVRQLIRAYNRQGLSLFPGSVTMPKALFSPDDPLTLAAQKIMADLLQQIQIYQQGLETTTDTVSVHETRKGVRSLRTALRLFAPYFEEGLLDGYRKRFRKFMRRLAHSRDVDVFLFKLDGYLAQNRPTASQQASFDSLRRCWQGRLEEANESIRKLMAKGKYHVLMDEFGRFTETDVRPADDLGDVIAPWKVRHLAPLFIAQKVTEVRAFDDHVQDASLARLHRLRIATKELRYTLEFFEPVLDPIVLSALETVKQLLLQLGDLNDARIHLQMLAETPGEEAAAAILVYRQAKEEELERLRQGLPGLWEALDSQAWRQTLATAVAVL
jgi:CHAD domain-containing protein